MPEPTMSLRRSSAASWKKARNEGKLAEKAGRLDHRNPLVQLAETQLGGEAEGADELGRGWSERDG